jgi:hypothetical protein
VEGKPLALAVLFSGILAIALGVLILHAASTPPPAPKRPEPPPPPSAMINSDMRFSVVYYKGLIESDAKSYGIPAPAYDDMCQPNPYFDELHEKQHLRIKAPIETRHLRITLEVTKQTTIIESHSLSTDHYILRIENRTPLYLAYRIQTSIGGEKSKCVNKGSQAHNAIALEPEQTIVRTECLYRKNSTIDINHIEVIELPALSAFYVSRLPPNNTLYDPRTAAGHTPPRGTMCPQTFSWREIKEGLDKNELGWRDVIDFYARHNCTEYSFFKSYRYRGDPGAPLPARDLD